MPIIAPVEGAPGGVTSAALNIYLPQPGVIVAHESGQIIASSVVSSLSGSFALLQSYSNIAGSGVYGSIWKLDAAAAGLHTITYTAGASSIDYVMAFAVTSATFDTSAQNLNSASGTGANALTTGNVVTNGADIVFGLVFALGSGANPTTGTAPIAFTNLALTFDNSNSPYWGQLEYYQQTNAGAINPTFGVSVSANYIGITVAVTPYTSTLMGGTCL